VSPPDVEAVAVASADPELDPRSTGSVAAGVGGRGPALGLGSGAPRLKAAIRSSSWDGADVSGVAASVS
jgi:hypothetical protein